MVNVYLRIPKLYDMIRNRQDHGNNYGVNSNLLNQQNYSVD